jgi:hypothetical protein
MKCLFLFIGCMALIFGEKVNAGYNLLPNHPSTTAINKQYVASASDYQESAVNISGSNIQQPHILRVNTSGSELQGQIIYDGRLIQQIRGREVQINLSPYLAVGEHRVEISTRYFPESASVSVSFTGPGVNVRQQTSGSGILTYILNIRVS